MTAVLFFKSFFPFYELTIVRVIQGPLRMLQTVENIQVEVCSLIPNAAKLCGHYIEL